MDDDDDDNDDDDNDDDDADLDLLALANARRNDALPPMPTRALGTDIDDNDNNNADIDRQLASFEMTMAALGDLSTRDASALTREARHERAHRMLAQFVQLAGMNMDEL